MKLKLFPSFFYVLLTGCELFLVSCSNSDSTTSVVEQPVTESVYASGVIKSMDQYDVFSPVNGIISEILVSEGDTVSKGTPLMHIDNAISAFQAENARIAMELSKELSGPASNSIQELEGRMKFSREKLWTDSLLFIRQSNLWKQDVGSKLDLEKRELAYKASATEYKSLLLQYNQLKSELEKKYRQSVNTFEISKKQQADLSVKSNMDGLVYDILKEPGEYVTTQTPIAIIGAAGTFEIELQVDEFDIVKVKPGQRVFLTLDSYHDRVFEAQVVKVEPIMNPRSRTFTVYAAFVKPPEVLYPNLTVEANVLIQKKDKALVIPASYLIANDRVLVSPDDTVRVKTGIMNMQWVEILEGLNKGQEIYQP